MSNLLMREKEFVTQQIMPFLRANWDTIDLYEPDSGYRDNRLTRDELALAYHDACAEKDSERAALLYEILKRYDAICLAYPDGYWYGEETDLGISEEDISVYAQMVDPEYTPIQGKPRPQPWF